METPRPGQSETTETSIESQATPSDEVVDQEIEQDRGVETQQRKKREVQKYTDEIARDRIPERQ